MPRVPFEIPIEHDAPRVVRGLADLPDGDGPFPFVILAHGYSSHLRWGFWPLVAERLCARGIAAVRFNFTGAGTGPDLETFVDRELFARATYLDELEDLELTRRIARSGELGPLDPERGGILGHSRGGGMSLVHAAEAGTYRAICTWAAIDQILRYPPEQIAEWREKGEIQVMHWGVGERTRLDVSVLHTAEANRERLDVGAACGRLDIPALVVHGGRDQAITLDASERIVAALPEGRARFLVIPDGSHSFGAWHPLTRVPDVLDRTIGETVAFFEQHLRP